MIYFWYGVLAVTLIAGSIGLIEIEFAFVAAVVLALIIRQY